MPGALSWDLFCRVIDNYGDAGVCWRLARQLAREHEARVRLWVDNLEVLHALHPDVDPVAPIQRACGVEIRLSNGDPSLPEPPGDVVIEAFGCGLPPRYAAAMTRRTPPPLWIVLEYLSAEDWVAQHHGLPSPPPGLALRRYFFFPGFTRDTGGLLRESDVAARRAAFGAGEREAFWRSCGLPPAPRDSLVVSLFAYDAAPAAPLLHCWEHGAEEVVVAVPEGHMARHTRAYFGGASGSVMRRGSLEARILPFLPQPRYDELLWCCDVNFVRGEDSFVRAQWAERPFVWQIYPQGEGAHRLKLDAFLDLYTNGLESAAAAALRAFWNCWNHIDAAPVNVAEAWRGFRSHARALEAHAALWPERVVQGGHLTARLAQFARERVK